MELIKAKDVLTRHVVDLGEAYLRQMNGKRSSAAKTVATVKAAIETGWLIGDDLTVKTVDGIPFAETKELAKSVDDLYAEVTEIDPN